MICNIYPYIHKVDLYVYKELLHVDMQYHFHLYLDKIDWLAWYKSNVQNGML